ncbi:MAG: hypothetical protein LBJ92_03805 [Holosporales bacterium]|jgi:hypothetical protein|nr:hypothetical protein [Holosporales bacterium]
MKIICKRTIGIMASMMLLAVNALGGQGTTAPRRDQSIRPLSDVILNQRDDVGARLAATQALIDDCLKIVSEQDLGDWLGELVANSYLPPACKIGNDILHTCFHQDSKLVQELQRWYNLAVQYPNGLSDRLIRLVEDFLTQVKTSAHDESFDWAQYKENFDRVQAKIVSQYTLEDPEVKFLINKEMIKEDDISRLRELLAERD